MKINRRIIVPLIFLFFKEAVYPSTASFLVFQNPSNKIENVKELIKKEEYTKALHIALDYDLTLQNQHEFDKRIELNLLIGDIFEKTNNTTKALQKYKELLSSLKRTSFEERDIINDKYDDYISLLLMKVGGNYHKIKQIDSAKIYYNKLINLDVKLNHNHKKNLAGVYANLSNVFREEYAYVKAKNFALKGINLYRELGEKMLESSALGNLANIHLAEGDYKKAKEIYSKGLDLIEKDNSNTATRFKEDLYYNLAYTLYMLKDHKAYEYQEKSYDIADNLRDKAIRRIVEEINAKHNVEAVQQVEENKRLKVEKSAWVIGVLGVLGTLLSLYFVNLFKLRQRNLSLRLSEQKLHQQKKLDEIKSESQIKIINATLDGKITERKQIAETLHDNVSALLSSANLHLTASKKQFKGNLPEEIIKTQEILAEASHQIRNLSHILMSSTLLKFGLEYAVKDIAKKYSNSVLSIHTNFNNIHRYPQDNEIKIFNIIQELTNNIIKHSNATEAFINLQEKDKTLFITIRDNGKGFDFETARNKEGVGLNQIDARVKMMEGNFDVNSNAKSGTSIKIKLPVCYKNEITNA